MSSRNHGVSLGWIVVCGSVVFSAAGCQATSGWAFNNSGKAYYQRGNYAMARDEFRRAAMDDPANPHYRHNLALAMKKTGDVHGAERVLRDNLTRVSAMHQPTYHSLAQILVEQNRHGEAQQLLAGWADTQPYVPEAQIELAWIQRETGNLPAAEQSLRRALQSNPQHSTALAHLGQLYQDAGQPDRAAAMYQRSLATGWQQPQVQSRLHMLADGSAARQSRLAMMMNPMSMSSTHAAARPMMGPVMSQSPTPMMLSSPTIVSNPAMAAAPTLGQQAVPVPSASSPAVVNSPGVTFETPIIAGPTLTPNADPAHTDMAAELPLVDPY